MKLLQIPPALIDQVWPSVEPFLSRAISYCRGTHVISTTHDRAKSGSAQLWVAVEDKKPHTIRAAAITNLSQFPSGSRALTIELLGGEKFDVFVDLRDELEAWALQNGCNLIFIWARKGWAKKLPDYSLTHYLMTKELRA